MRALILPLVLVSMMQSQTLPIEPCFKHHGRLATYSDIRLTMWLIGTTRVVYVDEAFGELPPVMQKYLALMPYPDHSYIYGDFEICRLESDKPGHMRRVRIVSAENLVVQDVDAKRPPFRLLSTWEPGGALRIGGK